MTYIRKDDRDRILRDSERRRDALYEAFCLYRPATFTGPEMPTRIDIVLECISSGGHIGKSIRAYRLTKDFQPTNGMTVAGQKRQHEVKVAWAKLCDAFENVSFDLSS